MIQHFYHWSGLTVEVLCATEEQARRLDRLWRAFFAVTPGSPQPPTFSLDYQQPVPDPATGLAAPMSPPPLLDEFCRDSQSVMWRTPEGLCLQVGSTWLAVATAQRKAHGVIDDSLWQLPITQQREFFLRSLLMLFSGQKYYGLHANGVVCARHSLLLIGPSGSGKTTLTLGLVQAGWHYLGDDSVALQPTATGVVAHALQKGFACTQQTLAFFPQLQGAVVQALDRNQAKYQVNMALLAPHQFTPSSRPTGLLFPVITGEPTSQLVPLAPAETLFRLVEQSAGIFTDRALAQQQMALLRDLAYQAPGYRLHLGKDAYRTPAVVATLWENAAREPVPTGSR
ncbi:MAG: hypothetical protein KF832_08205 [Caldilineaceae bacterium]|nr:hypothetical protein [Caldilineaceae bacterium]